MMKTYLNALYLLTPCFFYNSMLSMNNEFPSLKFVEREIFIYEIKRIGFPVMAHRLAQIKAYNAYSNRKGEHIIEYTPCNIVVKHKYYLTLKEHNHLLKKMVFEAIAHKEMQNNCMPSHNKSFGDYTKYWSGVDEGGAYYALETNFTRKEALQEVLNEFANFEFDDDDEDESADLINVK